MYQKKKEKIPKYIPEPCPPNKISRKIDSELSLSPSPKNVRNRRESKNNSIEDESRKPMRIGNTKTRQISIQNTSNYETKPKKKQSDLKLIKSSPDLNNYNVINPNDYSFDSSLSINGLSKELESNISSGSSKKKEKIYNPKRCSKKENVNRRKIDDTKNELRFVNIVDSSSELVEGGVKNALNDLAKEKHDRIIKAKNTYESQIKYLTQLNRLLQKSLELAQSISHQSVNKPKIYFQKNISWISIGKPRLIFNGSIEDEIPKNEKRICSKCNLIIKSNHRAFRLNDCNHLIHRECYIDCISAQSPPLKCLVAGCGTNLYRLESPISHSENIV